jgi:hypothetical protein
MHDPQTAVAPQLHNRTMARHTVSDGGQRAGQVHFVIRRGIILKCCTNGGYGYCVDMGGNGKEIFACANFIPNDCMKCQARRPYAMHTSGTAVIQAVNELNAGLALTHDAKTSYGILSSCMRMASRVMHLSKINPFQQD